MCDALKYNSTHKIEIAKPISESFQEKSPGGRDQLMFCLLLLFFVVCLQRVRLLVISSLFVSLRLNDCAIRVCSLCLLFCVLLCID